MPLWFGNQHAPEQEQSRLRHVARPALRARSDRATTWKRAVARANGWLLRAPEPRRRLRRRRGVESTIEETALAVEGLAAAGGAADAVARGCRWLAEQTAEGTPLRALADRPLLRQALVLGAAVSPDLQRRRAEPGPLMIYLDYNATTPLDPRVLEAMLPCYSERFGNASSRPHRYGAEARDAVEAARARGRRRDRRRSRGDRLDQRRDRVRQSRAARGRRRARVAEGNTSSPSRPSTAPCSIPASDWKPRASRSPVLGVDRRGVLDSTACRARSPPTTLVSVMHANNETGVARIRSPRSARSAARRARSSTRTRPSRSARSRST